MIPRGSMGASLQAPSDPEIVRPSLMSGRAVMSLPCFLRSPMYASHCFTNARWRSGAQVASWSALFLIRSMNSGMKHVAWGSLLRSVGSLAEPGLSCSRGLGLSRRNARERLLLHTSVSPCDGSPPRTPRSFYSLHDRCDPAPHGIDERGIERACRPVLETFGFGLPVREDVIRCRNLHRPGPARMLAIHDVGHQPMIDRVGDEVARAVRRQDACAAPRPVPGEVRVLELAPEVRRLGVEQPPREARIH